MDKHALSVCERSLYERSIDKKEIVACRAASCSIGKVAHTCRSVFSNNRSATQVNNFRWRIKRAFITVASRRVTIPRSRGLSKLSKFRKRVPPIAIVAAGWTRTFYEQKFLPKRSKCRNYRADGYPFYVYIVRRILREYLLANTFRLCVEYFAINAFGESELSLICPVTCFLQSKLMVIINSRWNVAQRDSWKWESLKDEIERNINFNSFIKIRRYTMKKKKHQ